MIFYSVASLDSLRNIENIPWSPLRGTVYEYKSARLILLVVELSVESVISEAWISFRIAHPWTIQCLAYIRP